MNNATKYVIRYTYPGTTSGKPVGQVYVQAVRERIPGFPMEAYSYTKSVDDATKWSYDEGVVALRTHYWTRAALVLAGEAERLLP